MVPTTEVPSIVDSSRLIGSAPCSDCSLDTWRGRRHRRLGRITSAAAAPFDSCADGIRAERAQGRRQGRYRRCRLPRDRLRREGGALLAQPAEYRWRSGITWRSWSTMRASQDGKKMMEAEAKNLRAIEKAYGVDRSVLRRCGGWRATMGRIEGDFFLPQGVREPACAGRRPAMFKSELDPGAKDRCGGGCEARRILRVPGRCLWPDSVHAVDLSPARGRFRSRRPKATRSTLLLMRSLRAPIS